MNTELYYEIPSKYIRKLVWTISDSYKNIDDRWRREKSPISSTIVSFGDDDMSDFSGKKVHYLLLIKIMLINFCLVNNIRVGLYAFDDEYWNTE